MSGVGVRVSGGGVRVLGFWLDFRSEGSVLRLGIRVRCLLSG